MADWLTPFITFFPLYAWWFLGLGIPWALVLLPRDEWRNHPTVAALAMALGPIIGSVWLFFLGTFGTFTIEYTLTGMVLLTLIGITGAWLRRYTGYTPPHTRPEPWTGIERTVLMMVAIAFVIHVWITMFWPFVQYDTLWTFGYNPKIFYLYESIPDFIDYYPQLVPLTYTYGYIVNDGINDHVAKAAVPWFVFASILMAYILGTRVWGKRTIGVFTAGLWMLIPTALYWSSAGDLEHPITVYFTGAIVFFALAWRSHQWRYAVISGLLFSGALWTKPTAGAFGLGVVLLVGLLAGRFMLPRIVQERLRLAPADADVQQMFWQKFRIAAITGITCFPIGIMWYLRNYLLDHEPITMPPDYWTTLAQRSGQELGWLVVIAALGVGHITYQQWDQRQLPTVRKQLGIAWLGFGLFLLGTLPSALVLEQDWTRFSFWEWVNGARPQDNPLNILEIILILSGLGLLASQAAMFWRKTTPRARSSALVLGVLITPFTLVWFWNYSYHYRLMLTITPVLASFTAALLDAWVLPLFQATPFRSRSAILLVTLLSIPAFGVASWLTFIHTVVDPLHNDQEKYEAANPPLMEMVAAIEDEIASRPFQDHFIVYTFGENRINFFFPENRTIYDDPILTAINDLHPLTSVLIGGSHADFLWQVQGTYPNEISVMMEMGWEYTRPFVEYQQGNIFGMLFTPLQLVDNGTDKRIIYEMYTPYRNYTIQELNTPIQFTDNQWGDIALRGIDIRLPVAGDSVWVPPDENGIITLPRGEPIYLMLYWQRTTENPIPIDYSVFVHLVDAETGEILSQRDGALQDGNMPFPVMPYPDLIPDRRLWFLEVPPEKISSGAVNLVIGLYDPLHPTQERVIISQGTFTGEDGLVISDRFRLE